VALDPDELTRLVQADRTVADAGAMTGPGPGEITVFVVPQGYRTGPVIRQRVLDLAGGHDPARPVQVAVVRQVPRDPGGGVDRETAGALIGRPGVLYPFEPPRDGTERTLVDLVRQVLPDVAISMTDALAPLGGDSLTAVELLALIQESFGVELDPQSLYAAETLRELAVCIGHSIASGQAG
jgi:acyl carrier protein